MVVTLVLHFVAYLGEIPLDGTVQNYREGNKFRLS